MKIVEFPISTLADVPAKLRQLADDIEANRYGPVGSCGVAILGDTFEMFGFGQDSDAPSIALLFQAGLIRFSNSIERHGH